MLGSCPPSDLAPPLPATLRNPDPKTVTRILQEARAGKADASQALLHAVYEDLQVIAGRLFSNERNDHTLQPTALINEAWLKLDGQLLSIQDRTHFFAVASQAMRQVLTDHARSAGRQKRGGGKRAVTFDGQAVSSECQGLDLIDLEDTLARLSHINGRHARLVELRIFGGLTLPEISGVLEVSQSTVEREWFSVRAWLRRELSSAS